MAPTIVMAPRHMQLENCAAWHDGRAVGLRREAGSKSDSAIRLRLHQDADRHDMIAFRLFREAHQLRSQHINQAV